MFTRTKLYLAGLIGPFALPLTVHPTAFLSARSGDTRLLTANEVCASNCTVVNPFWKCCEGTKWLEGSSCDGDPKTYCPNDGCTGGG